MSLPKQNAVKIEQVEDITVVVGNEEKEEWITTEKLNPVKVKDYR